MNLESTLRQARGGELYPSCILHGSDDRCRRAAALEIARSLLCDESEDQRPCGVCRHCRRIGWPEAGRELFHPDFQVLERDLRTSTSVEAARTFLRAAQLKPFEARGQVFAVAAAESLTPEAANAFLKVLEEPHTASPRNFLLLAPSQFDLLPTLRSRSLAIYLGGGDRVDAGQIEGISEALVAALGSWVQTANRMDLFTIANTLQQAGGWQDPRSRRPWEVAAAAVVRASGEVDLTSDQKRRLLSLAEDLLGGPDMRMRGIQPQRILEGLVHARLEG